MDPASYNVTDAELAILEVLWQNPGRTIGEISAAIYPARTTARYATVQKLLERLEAKGCVERDRSAFAHLFRARVDREQLIGRRLQEVAEKLCDGSLTPLLLHLVESTPLSAADRARLHQLIDSAERRPNRPKPS